MAANNKVFILDKYFKELQKFWETGKMLQGNHLIKFLIWIQTNNKLKSLKFLRLYLKFVYHWEKFNNNLNFINIFFVDASSNEAVHLQQKLKSLSTELVTLRNRLHVNGPYNQSSGVNFQASSLTQTNVPSKNMVNMQISCFIK